MISCILGIQHGIGPDWATTFILLVTFIKVRLIGSYFMEIRESPLSLRLVWDGYCFLVCAVLITIYYTG